MPKFDSEAIEKNIGYVFKNKDLLKQAMSHSSYINELTVNNGESYERLEFLGDAVLELVSSTFLFEEYKELTEGELTKLRASLVCEHTLSSISKELKFGKYVLLSKGEDLTGGRDRSSILCDLFESVLGAIYLDGGMVPAKAYVKNFLLTDIENKSLFYDAKTALQEIVQKVDNTLKINYEVVSETGPDHNKTYNVVLYIGDKKMCEGSGSSKKHAQQMAAYNTVIKIREKGIDSFAL